MNHDRDRELHDHYQVNECCNKVHVVSPLETDESVLMSSDFHVNFSSLNFDKEFFARENYQQFQKDFVSLDCYEVYDVHGLFQGDRGDHIFINEAVFNQEQTCLLNQLKAYHILQHPVVEWMDFYCSRIENVASFCILPICSCEYKLFMEFLRMLYSFAFSRMVANKGSISSIKYFHGFIGKMIIHEKKVSVV